MNINASMRRMAIAAALAAATCAGSVAHAQQDGMATEAMAQQIRDTIALLPADASSQVTVAVEDGRYEIGGFVHGNDYEQDARNAIDGIDGLDLGLVDIRVIPQ